MDYIHLAGLNATARAGRRIVRTGTTAGQGPTIFLRFPGGPSLSWINRARNFYRRRLRRRRPGRAAAQIEGSRPPERQRPDFVRRRSIGESRGSLKFNLFHSENSDPRAPRAARHSIDNGARVIRFPFRTK